MRSTVRKTICISFISAVSCMTVGFLAGRLTSHGLIESDSEDSRESRTHNDRSGDHKISTPRFTGLTSSAGCVRSIHTNIGGMGDILWTTY